MVYLERFSLTSPIAEERFFNSPKSSMTCYTSYYPFELFRYRNFPDEFIFSDITVFCGNNGSGKSTILNTIAEKLNLKRATPFNKTDFFTDYVEFCNYYANCCLPQESSILTSDDVFEKILDIRRINDGIDNRRTEIVSKWIDKRFNEKGDNLHGLDDYDRWRDVVDAQDSKRSQSSYIKARLKRNIQERSNGESALSLFVDKIYDNTLYLLDEPENSLSPSNQLELKYFIEDCVRNHGCQFIISTHSPFLLSLKGAKIYDIDSEPVMVKKWTDLDCVNVYRDFFKEYDYMF